VCKDDSVRHDVFVDMVFNMGISRFSKFKKMLAAYEVDNYLEASRQMLDSKWARQVKGRAKRLAKMMKTGVYDVR